MMEVVEYRGLISTVYKFVSSFLTHAKKLDGRDFLIDDNPSFYFTVDVLRFCAENLTSI